MGASFIHDGIFKGLILCSRLCVGMHRFCVVTIARAMQLPDGTVSVHFFPFSSTYITTPAPATNISAIFPGPWKEIYDVSIYD